MAYLILASSSSETVDVQPESLLPETLGRSDREIDVRDMEAGRSEVTEFFDTVMEFFED